MDVKKMCRLCAEYRLNQQLTPLNDPSRRIKSKLFRCSQIDLSLNDNSLLPQSVCSECIECLEKCWQFAEAVAKAQDKLQLEFAKDPLANIKIEEQEEKEEEDNVNDSQLADSTAFNGAKTKDQSHVNDRALSSNAMLKVQQNTCLNCNTVLPSASKFCEHMKIFFNTCGKQFATRSKLQVSEWKNKI